MQRPPQLLVSELMFLTASAVVVWLTHLSWLPCAGSMLRGTPFDSAQQADFSEACLRAMDSSIGFPLATWLESPQQLVNALNAAALVLLGLGWLALVRSWGSPRKDLALATAPGLLNLLLAGIAAVALVQPPAEMPWIASVTMLLIDVSTVVAVIVLLTIAAPGQSTLTQVRLVLLALAACAAGIGRLMVDYVFMIGFSEANWDSPPGSGYLTAFSIGVFALLSLLLGVFQRVREPSPA